MKQIIDELVKKENVRSNLSEARKRIKDAVCGQECTKQLLEYQELIKNFLKDEDPKTRKNAALLLGDLSVDAVEEVFRAYQQEQTRFVKSSYLVALAQMNVIEKLPELRDILDELLEVEITEENRKHVEEEIRQLRKILIAYEGITKHTFTYPKVALEVMKQDFFTIFPTLSAT